MISAGKSFEKNRLAGHGKGSFFESLFDLFQAGFFVVEIDDQNVRLLNVMLADAVNFLQDRPYPLAGASGVTPGDGHLNDPLNREGRMNREHEKKYQEKTSDFLHRKLPFWIRRLNTPTSRKMQRQFQLTGPALFEIQHQNGGRKNL